MTLTMRTYDQLDAENRKLRAENAAMRARMAEAARMAAEMRADLQAMSSPPPFRRPFLRLVSTRP